MKLYVCWGTRGGAFHACGRAYDALRAAGHRPKVTAVRGSARLPKGLHLMTEGRREVERVSGQVKVPVLVTDDGEVICGSAEIVAWAERRPAHSNPAETRAKD